MCKKHKLVSLRYFNSQANFFKKTTYKITCKNICAEIIKGKLCFLLFSPRYLFADREIVLYMCIFVLVSHESGVTVMNSRALTHR